MLKIRLQMTGRRNDRHFRVVVIEHTRGPKSGKYVEKIGFVNPRTKEVKIDTERAKYWLSVGAQATGRVYNYLVDLGVLEGPKKNVLPRKTPIKKESEEAETQEASTEEATENAGETDENSENQEEAAEVQEENKEG